MIIDKIFEIGSLLAEKMAEKNMTFSAAKEQTKKIIRDSIRPKIGKYLLSLFFLFLLAWLPPLAIMIAGVFYGSKTLIVFSGCLRAVCTIILLAWATPLGILLEIIFGGISGSGERYARLALGIFITELFFTLIACFIPFANRPDLISPFILAAFILGFLNAWFFRPKIVASITGILFVGMLISFFIPAMPFSAGRFGDFAFKVGRNIYSPNLISKSCEELRSEGILYSVDGSNKYWYHESTNDKIRLYDGKGNDTIDGTPLEPFERNALEDYCKQEKENTNGKLMIVLPSKGMDISKYPVEIWFDAGEYRLEPKNSGTKITQIRFVQSGEKNYKNLKDGTSFIIPVGQTVAIRTDWPKVRIYQIQNPAGGNSAPSSDTDQSGKSFSKVFSVGKYSVQPASGVSFDGQTWTKTESFGIRKGEQEVFFKDPNVKIRKEE